jgi:hypothetical protein
MLYLVNSFTTTPDVNGNSRVIFEVTCVENDQVTNVLWHKVDYYVVPRNAKELNEYMDVHEDDNVTYVGSYHLTEQEYESKLKSHVTN